MLQKITPLSFLKILKSIKIYDSPNLKVNNCFFNIDTFFYKYSLIKILREKNNLFISLRKTKITFANLKRFKRSFKNF